MLLALTAVALQNSQNHGLETIAPRYAPLKANPFANISYVLPIA
jgi:hypothetical protein